MTLSQEILVLDLGDEKQSDYLKSDLASADFGKGNHFTIFLQSIAIISFVT